MPEELPFDIPPEYKEELQIAYEKDFREFDIADSFDPLFTALSHPVEYDSTAECFILDFENDGPCVFMKTDSDYPELITMQEFKDIYTDLSLDIIEFKLEELGVLSSVDNTENSTQQNNVTLAKGKVTLIKDIRIRSGAGTNFENVGTLSKNTTVEYFDKIVRDGYTWYRIGNNQWIANDGTWLVEESDLTITNNITTEDVIKIAQKNATWTDEWYKKYPDGKDFGWECEQITEDTPYLIESFKNGKLLCEDIIIPAGSYKGGRWITAEGGIWQLYEFAYVKKGNGYELIDLFRQDEADAYEVFLEETAFRECQDILNSILTHPTDISFISAIDGEYTNSDQKLGTGYRFYFHNSTDDLYIHPNVGYAYLSTWDETKQDIVDIPLMIDYQVIDIYDN